MDNRDKMLVAGLAGLVGGELHKVDKLTAESVNGGKGPSNRINLQRFIPNGQQAPQIQSQSEGIMVEAPAMIPIPQDLRRSAAHHLGGDVNTISQPIPQINAPGSPTVASNALVDVLSKIPKMLESIERIEAKLDLIMKTTKIRKK